MQDQPRQRRSRVITRLLLSIVLLGLAIGIFFNRQTIIDEIALRQYQPSDRVAAIARDTTMTPEATRYFYASRPEINDAADFRTNCGSSEEQTIILGCYNAQRIYLFNVTDQRLPRVMEVTAAHEMLHAAYQRLSPIDKSKIDGLISAQIEKTSDQRIKDLIALYNRTEPGQLLNEMHSIFATEVTDISPELEDHFRTYFTDRSKIVGYSNGYEAVFTDISNKQAQLTKELNATRDQINDRNAAYSRDVEQLNKDIADFNRRANDGSFSSTDQFNQQRQELIDRQARLRDERTAINALVASYNTKRQELIDLNAQVQSLNDSLDSTPKGPQEDVPAVE